MNLDGKIAVVTGGSRGIGRTISLRLAERGAFVYVNYVSRSDAAEETIAQFAEVGGKGAVIQFDVADFSATLDAFQKDQIRLGILSISCKQCGNNPG